MSICVPQFGDREGEGRSLPLEIHIYTFVVHIYLQSDVSLCPQPLISWVVTHRGATKSLHCCFMTSVNGAGSGGWWVGGGGTGMVTLTRVTIAKQMWDGEHAQI